jgi:hypothetical protein
VALFIIKARDVELEHWSVRCLKAVYLFYPSLDVRNVLAVDIDDGQETADCVVSRSGAAHGR